MRRPRLAGIPAVLLLFVAASMAFSFDAVGQSARLAGTVSDASTEQPLIGANVVLTLAGDASGTQGRATSETGEFVFPALRAGTYRLVVSYTGYESYVDEDLDIRDGESMQLDIPLTPTVFYLDAVLVETVSRRPERAMTAPAAVSVISAEEMQGRPNLSLTEHLKTVPGVDIVDAGLFNSSVFARGFLEASDAGRFLLLTDNRIASTASFRVNAFPQLTSIDTDVKRIEYVAGPGSALYGPNAVSGVVHVLTRSPFDSPGTTLSVTGGNRSVFKTAVRHAGVIGPSIGYKITGHYLSGNDWESVDPAEPDSIVKGKPTADGRVAVSDLIPNQRDFDIEKIGVEGTLEYRSRMGLRAVVTGGFTRISALNVIDLGGLQIADWDYFLLQARVFYKDLFAQVFLNQNDTGDTFFLRSGDLIRDRSQQWVAQLQHGRSMFEGRQRFTYGVDALLTRPRSESTVLGRNEENDAINEYGVFVQSETELTSNVRFIAAGRLDEQNVLKDPVFSPRLALVVNPSPDHTVRFMFNRAHKSVGTLDLFIDINVVPSLGPFPYAVRVRGVPPESGYTFMRDTGGGVGGLYMQSPFTPSGAGGREAFVPAEATQYWGAVVAFLQSQGVDLSTLPAPTSADVATQLALLDPNTQSFVPVSTDDVSDVPPLEPLRISTFELGYTGLISQRLMITANLYREQNRNFLGPTLNETPNVFLDQGSLTNYLARFMPLDQATGLAEGIAGVPLGTVTPEQSDAADILLTTRSFGEITHYGAELGLNVFATPEWMLTGTYSYLSDNFFERSGSDPDDISLNAPRHRFGGAVRYQNDSAGFEGQVRIRHVDSFPVISGLGRERLPSFSVVDVSASYRLPMLRQLQAAVSIQNAFDNRHREFLGTPEIGRLVLLRLQYEL